ncbi:hypothetical protein ACDN41_11775 [Priestia aryabhattai]|uniref:hypothetical protein n=1 Tax=Priestia aryabhattai TaxID=412384 RepID=UPI0035322D6D
MLDNMKQNKDKVEYILANYPESRNSDRLLVKLFWQHMDGIHTIDEILNATPSASIERVRREFTSDGKYLATDEKVRKARRIQADYTRKNIHTL